MSSELNEREITSIKSQIGDLYSEVRRLDTENRTRDRELMRAEVVREYEEQHKQEAKLDADDRDKKIQGHSDKLIKWGAYAVAGFAVAKALGLFDGMNV